MIVYEVQHVRADGANAMEHAFGDSAEKSRLVLKCAQFWDSEFLVAGRIVNPAYAPVGHVQFQTVLWLGIMMIYMVSYLGKQSGTRAYPAKLGPTT